MPYKNITNRLTHHCATLFELTHRLLDGAYMGNSMLDYASEVPTHSLASAQHLDAHFHHNPHDMGFSLAESVVFILFSLCANEQTQDHRWLKYAYLLWPYLRNFCSGLKNGRHAAVNIGILAHNAYRFCNPIGLSIGAIYAVVLTWYYHQDQKRDQGMQDNNHLLQEIQEKGWNQLVSNRQIYCYSKTKSTVMYLIAGADGLLDGLYMYGCLHLMMTVLAIGGGVFWPVALAAVIAGSFALISLTYKLYREYKKQQALKKSVAQCKLALLDNQLKSAQKNLEKAKTALEDFNNTKPSKPLSQDENKQLQDLEKQYEHAKENLDAITAQHQKQTDYKNQLDKPYIPQSIVAKAIWPVIRAFISGVKNAHAALQSIGAFIKKAFIIPLALMIGGIFYGIYLAVKEGYKMLAPHFRKPLSNHLASQSHRLFRQNKEDKETTPHSISTQSLVNNTALVS